MKTNLLLRNVGGFLGIFIVTLLFAQTANAQDQILANTSMPKGSHPAIAKANVSTKALLQGDSVYTSKDGYVFKKGESITLGETSWDAPGYQYIISSSTLNSPDYLKKYLPSDYPKKEVVIQNIKKTDGRVYLQINFKDTGKLSVDIEQALTSKEVLVN